MFKFYNFFKSQAGRNNSGAVTVRHRSRPYIQKTYYNYFNAKHSEFKHFQPIKANTFFSIFSRYSGSRLYSFSISRQQSRPLPLYSFRPGSFVNNVESRPGSGSKFARATYSKAIIIRRVGTNSILTLPSGEIQLILA
jgi:ribosomal protein L2